MKKFKPIFAALMVATSTLTGCASWLNTADSAEFSCPGMPQGVVCKTPMAVYKGGDNNAADNKEQLQQGKTAAPAPDISLPGLKATSGGPKPLLMPPVVMRIWIAPWTDSKGDLHYPSYLFTEIQPKKWSIGKVDKDVNGEGGIIVPHRDVEAAPEKPKDDSKQDQTKKMKKPGGQPADKDGEAAQDNLAEGSEGAKAAAAAMKLPTTGQPKEPTMPSPSDINLD